MGLRYLLICLLLPHIERPKANECNGQQQRQQGTCLYAVDCSNLVQQGGSYRRRVEREPLAVCHGWIVAASVPSVKATRALCRLARLRL